MQNFPAKTLNIVGCGNLGATLGSAWHQKAILHLQGIYNRRQEKALKALSYLGLNDVSNGDSCHSSACVIAPHLSDLPSADLWLLACPDDQIATVSDQLAQMPVQWQDAVVFHCSGALSSCELESLAKKGAATASVHPAFSFANPAQDAQHLHGSLCTAEGSDNALEHLQPLFEAIGFQWAAISAENKSLYHAGTVIGCNYLVTLMNASLECLIQSGLPEATARQLIQPLANRTLDNVTHHPPEQVLTGPIRRGDTKTVEQHIQTLSNLPEIQSLYQTLGKHTLPLAESSLTTDGLNQLKTILDA